jgi:hypothetical protein
MNLWAIYICIQNYKRYAHTYNDDTEIIDDDDDDNREPEIEQEINGNAILYFAKIIVFYTMF